MFSIYNLATTQLGTFCFFNFFICYNTSILKNKSTFNVSKTSFFRSSMPLLTIKSHARRVIATLHDLLWPYLMTTDYQS